MASKTLQFLSISNFKAKLGVSTLQIVDAPKTPGKLAVLADETEWFRCATNINVKEHMAFVMDTAEPEKGWCLCNVNPPKTLNVRATL